ncbi:N-terminal kinase-like protein [Bienertia sinuspersici]
MTLKEVEELRCMVRHPNILSFLHSTEVETFDGSTTKVTIYIVTEPVMPLAEKIKELGLDGKQRDEYYAWGLHQIAKAVSFLNNDCKLIHANVCLASVVVTQTLDWKLHAFDVLSEFEGNKEGSTGSMLLYAVLSQRVSDQPREDWLGVFLSYFNNFMFTRITFVGRLLLMCAAICVACWHTIQTNGIGQV